MTKQRPYLAARSDKRLGDQSVKVMVSGPRTGHWLCVWSVQVAWCTCCPSAWVPWAPPSASTASSWPTRTTCCCVCASWPACHPRCSTSSGTETSSSVSTPWAAHDPGAVSDRWSSGITILKLFTRLPHSSHARSFSHSSVGLVLIFGHVDCGQGFTQDNNVASHTFLVDTWKLTHILDNCLQYSATLQIFK